MKFIRAFALAAFVAPTTLTAQDMTGIPSVDSAAAARAAWNTAVRAFRQGNVAAARRAIDRAAQAWSEQAAYVWQHAALAARMRDTTNAMNGLRDYARLGLGRDLRDTLFDFLRPVNGFTAIDSAHRANLAPMARSAVYATLSDSTLWPEGVDVDPVTGTAYVASIRHGNVVVIDRNGRERRLLADASGRGAFFGVRLAPDRKSLWVTAGSAPGVTSRAALMQVDATSGAILRRIELDTLAHTLGDLAVAPNGEVLVTDSDAPVLYRLKRGAAELEEIRHPTFRSLQGVAIAPDGAHAYVADYSHGLLRVDLNAKSVLRLDAPAGTTTLGVDGIALHGDAIVAVQNGVAPARIMRFRLAHGGTRIAGAEVIDRNLPLADEPTIGAVVGDRFIYVANSQWEKHGRDGALVNGAVLAKPVLLALPLAGR